MTNLPTAELKEIATISDIQHLVTSGFSEWKQYGEVNVTEKDGLLIFNYTPVAQYTGTWNAFEIMSRGLIIDKASGEIAARSFDKFFNWGEGGRFSQARIVSVTEKMDGSLGILYRRNGEYKIATRGSFDSDQAVWATEFWNRNFAGLIVPYSWTMLFEIVYPGNRIVVDYGDTQALVLIAVRNRFTGEYIPFNVVSKFANHVGFPVPKVYDFDEASEIVKSIASLDANHEGFVVEFEDGQRFKFKGQRYLELHKLISSLSFKNTLTAYAAGTLDYIREQVPDEFLGEFEGWVNTIEETVKATNETVHSVFADAPKGDRKEFALWVTSNHRDVAPYLFALYDGRDIAPMIYQMGFKQLTQ